MECLEVYPNSASVSSMLDAASAKVLQHSSDSGLNLYISYPSDITEVLALSSALKNSPPLQDLSALASTEATYMAKRKTVYLPTKDYELLDIDILTLIYDSPESWGQESTVLHAEAALPSNAITKSQARTFTKRLAWVFRNKFSVGANGPGKDVVVCISSGQVLLSNVFYGVIAAGGVFSAASSSYTSGELARQIKQGRSSVVVCSEDCKDVAVKAAKECGVPLERVLILESMGGKRVLRDVEGRGRNLLEDGEREWRRAGQLMEWKKITDREVLRERVICLLYSSGTTGVPKGKATIIPYAFVEKVPNLTKVSISRTGTSSLKD